MAVHIVNSLETINSFTSYPDGITIQSGGILRLTNGADLETKWIKIMSGGALDIPSVATTDSIQIKLEGNTIDDGEGEEGHIMPMGGLFSIDGPDAATLKPWTRLTADALIGATSIDVEDVTGWKIGDTIAIAPSGILGWEEEERVITNIVSTTVSFADPLIYEHAGGRSAVEVDVDGNIKYVNCSAEVANLTRPVEIYTDSSDIYGAHIMAMMGGAMELQGARFSYLGMTEPSEHPYKPLGDATPSPRSDVSPTGKGRAGRYAIHWHENGDNSRGDFINNCVAYRSRHKSFVIHDSNGVTANDNVSYRGVSHQFSVGEDGTEQDLVLERNLVIYCRRLYNGDGGVDNIFDWAFVQTSPTRDNRISGGSAQNEMHPGAFWITTPSVTLRDNVVAGGVAAIGYYFDFFGGRVSGAFDRLDENIKNATLVFENNLAHSLTIESGHKYGTTQDVNSGSQCFATLGAILSYRSSGWAVWIDQYMPEYSEEGQRNPRNFRRGASDTEYLLTGTRFYNCTGGIWSESSSFKIENTAGFHFQIPINIIGGAIEDANFDHADLLGAVSISALTDSNPAVVAGLVNDSTHFEGYYIDDSGLGSMNICSAFSSSTFEGIVSATVDASGGVIVAKNPFSLKGVRLKGSPFYIRLAQAFEGPAYIKDWVAVDSGGTSLVSPIEVNRSLDPTEYHGGDNTVSYTTSNGTERYDTAYNGNGVLFDLDNDLAYFLNNTTDTASDYVVVRVTSTNGLPLDVISNEGSATIWYDTNQLREFSGFVDPGYDTSCTAVLSEGGSDTITINSSATFNVDVFGAKEEAAVTINGNTYTYRSQDYLDPFSLSSLGVTSSSGSGTGTSFDYKVTNVTICLNNSCAVIYY